MTRTPFIGADCRDELEELLFPEGSIEGRDFAGAIKFVRGRSIVTIGGHDWLELGNLLSDLTRTMRVDSDLGIGLLREQIGVFLGNFFETIQHDALALSRPRS